MHNQAWACPPLRPIPASGELAAPLSQSPAMPPLRSQPAAPEMNAESPRLLLLRRLGSHISLHYPVEKRARQLPLTGIAFAVNRAQIEELVAKRILLFLLGKDWLQRNSQLSQPRSLRPGLILIAAQILVSGEQATA